MSRLQVDSLDQLRRDLGRGSTGPGRSLTASASGSTGRRSGCWRRCRASATRATSAIAGLLWTPASPRVAFGYLIAWMVLGLIGAGPRRSASVVTRAWSRRPPVILFGGVGSGEFGWLDG
jgi:hypothetical protein